MPSNSAILDFERDGRGGLPAGGERGRGGPPSMFRGAPIRVRFLDDSRDGRGGLPAGGEHGRSGPPSMFRGAPIEVRFLDDPRAWRGRLLAGDERGQPVHAGTFVRRRLIVLDRALLDSPRELARILAHELFHFVWFRLGNPSRREWEKLLAGEIRAGVSGELGWSAEWRKGELRRADRARRTRRWREYACESYCDTAAWVLCGGRHAQFTLGRQARAARRSWFCNLLSRRVSI